jgi:phosphoglycolate phosphatase
VDVRERHYRTYRAAVEAFGGRPLGGTSYWTLKRRGARWAEVLARSEIDTRREGAFLERFVARIEAPGNLRLDRLFPSVPEMLEALGRGGGRLFLVSLRRSSSGLRRQLHDLGIATAFERVCSGHAEARSHLQKANLIRQLGVVPPAVLVGDTEADVLAAELLGLGAIGVSSGMRNRRYLTDIGADVVVEQVAQVPTVLDSVSPSSAATQAAWSAMPSASDTAGR